MRHRLSLVSGMAILSLLVFIPVSGWAAMYVDVDNVTGPWDGSRWSSAYKSVQEGIAAAKKGNEVWVAEGIYKPTLGTGRKVSFQLKSGVALYGGFEGKETKRNRRDWAKNVTILSGDIGKPDDNSDNSYHVVVGADKAVIDGFTIRCGNADGNAYYSKGGGMVNYYACSPTVTNCTFTGNRAGEGGGMYNYDDCSPAITNCTFAGNSADKGGAMVNRDGSNCTATNCTFTGNHAKWRGGAVFNDYGSSPIFTNCTFANNSTDGNGAGMYTDDTASQIGHTSPKVVKCTFTANTAKFRGGGMANFNKCTPIVTGCTFTGNCAGKGGGAISNDYQVVATVTNCTFTKNSAGTGKADIDTDSTSVVNSTRIR